MIEQNARCVCLPTLLIVTWDFLGFRGVCVGGGGGRGVSVWDYPGANICGLIGTSDDWSIYVSWRTW